MSRDLLVVLTARGLRAVAFGYSSVLIGVFLEARGLGPFLVGMALTVALIGSASLGILASWLARWMGRRRLLALSGVLMAVTGLDLALAHQTVLLAAAGITGMLGTGSFDIGTFAGLEQAVVADSVNADRQTGAFGHYWLVGTLAAAGGGALAALAGDPARSAFFFYGYAMIGLITGGMALQLSARADRGVPLAALPSLSNHSPARAQALIGLFTIDALAGGVTSPTILLYWLHLRFGVGTSLLGPTYAAMFLVSAASFEAAAGVVRRFGLAAALVYPLMMANLLLALVTVAPSFAWAVAILLARTAVGNVDVPARTGYLLSLVPSTDGPALASLASATRGLASAAGPFLTGMLLQVPALAAPLLITSAGKTSYCALLLLFLRRWRLAGDSAHA